MTTTAKKFWESIPPEAKVKILNNVWCGTCQGTSSLGNPTMTIQSQNLIIRGICTKCGGQVARRVESE